MVTKCLPIFPNYMAVGCGTWCTWLISDWKRWLSPVQTWTKDLHFSLTVPNAAICQPLEQTLKPGWWDSWGMLAKVYKTSVHPIGWLRLRDLKVELREYQIFFSPNNKNLQNTSQLVSENIMENNHAVCGVRWWWGDEMAANVLTIYVFPIATIPF